MEITMLKYQEIALKIEKKIHFENLEQGSRLPSLGELITQYQVSKSTIVKSLAILENRGIIFQVQGSGIFVRKRKRKGYINFMENQGFTHDLEEFNLTSTILNLEIIYPNEEIMNNLNCSANEEVYWVKRIRYINGQTLCVEESYYKKEIVPYLNKEILNDSIFEYLQNALNINIGFSDKYLKVGKINTELAAQLQLPDKSPALFVEELFYLNTGEPFDFSKTIYNYEHSQFFLQGSNAKN